MTTGQPNAPRLRVSLQFAGESFRIRFVTAEWKHVDLIAGHLSEALGEPPDVVLVLGSGLKDTAFSLEQERTISFSDIPGWPVSTVEGHSGVLRKGRLGDVEVLMQLGRVHLYEGYSPQEVVRPVRASIAWGARTVVLTNAAGGINAVLKPGTLMIIEDHINLTGVNPLMGGNDEHRGPRFPDMGDAYSRNLRARLVEAASRLDIPFRMGVYAGLMGPSYETPAEVKMLRTLGVDAVGMSTVLEAIAAAHMGATVAGISCISNMAATYDGPRLSHEDVKGAAALASDNLMRLLSAFAKQMKSAS